MQGTAAEDLYCFLKLFTRVFLKKLLDLGNKQVIGIIRRFDLH